MLAVLFTACPSYPEDTTGSISGTIRDAIDDTPLQGASVTLSPSGRTSVTGNDGHYQFQDVEMGNYTVSVTRTNYLPTSQTASVSVGQNTIQNFTLSRANSDLEVTPQSLDFGKSDTNRSITIKNVGWAEMICSIVRGNSADTWISWEPGPDTSEKILPGQQGSVTIIVDRSGLTAGTYNSKLLVISSNGGGVKVTLTMVVDSDN